MLQLPTSFFLMLIKLDRCATLLISFSCRSLDFLGKHTCLDGEAMVSELLFSSNETHESIQGGKHALSNVIP
jgi:hypothetical protein